MAKTDSLARQARVFACLAGHSFDIAREGYVNLLPANHKRSRDPGDNREMIDARRRVHAARLYQPLAERVADIVATMAGEGDAVLDLGCGEGYYAGVVLQRCPGVALYGVDISKAAVRLAARVLTGAQFAVASAARVPLPAGSVDAVISVFAPVVGEELQRLLRPGGCYVKVTPAPKHLWALRELLYDEPRPHKDAADLPRGFVQVVKEEIGFGVDLEGQLLQDLVTMTPYAYRGQRENKERLAGLERLSLEMAFQLTVAMLLMLVPIATVLATSTVKLSVTELPGSSTP